MLGRGCGRRVPPAIRSVDLLCIHGVFCVTVRTPARRVESEASYPRVAVGAARGGRSGGGEIMRDSGESVERESVAVTDRRAAAISNRGASPSTWPPAQAKRRGREAEPVGATPDRARAAPFVAQESLTRSRFVVCVCVGADHVLTMMLSIMLHDALDYSRDTDRHRDRQSLCECEQGHTNVATYARCHPRRVSCTRT